MSLWNDETIEELRNLWKQGYSASQVAEKLGPDYTKNAVIGKIHRLKISKEGTRIPRPAAPRKTAEKKKGVSRTRRVVAQTVARKQDAFFTSRLYIEEIPDISFLLPDTTHFGHSAAVMSLTPSSCRWPVGDPLKPDFRFCGAEAAGVYCDHHQNLSYNGKTRRDSKNYGEQERRYA